MGQRGFSILGDIVATIVLVSALGFVAHLERDARLVQKDTSRKFLPVSLPGAASAMVEYSQPVVRPDDTTAAEQRVQYAADAPKSIVELQQFRHIQTIVLPDKQGFATLSNLNPDINAAFLLTVDLGGGAGLARYHIENPGNKIQRLTLVGEAFPGLNLINGNTVTPCELWSGKPSMLEKASASPLPFAPLCDGQLLLRNRVTGHRTNLELVTDLLRDNVWRGEDIVGFVRDVFFKDAFRETGHAENLEGAPPAEVLTPASLSAAYANKAVVPRDLAIDVGAPPSRQLGLGRWYAVRQLQGVFVSVMQPQAVSEAIIERGKSLLNNLDPAEASAFNYLVAFDLSQYDLQYAIGTEHPRLGWSPRALSPNSKLPGPDGISNPAPIVTTGMLSPALLGRVVGTFTGGFKREHGAFKHGDLAKANHSSHYGFIENGVVFSKLHPGLATLYVLDDGTVQMKTWTDSDNRFLARIRFARQNGVALVESDATGQNPVPGPFVAKWGLGNWSGSADAKLRTLRGGVCFQQAGSKQFLIYGYFSTATPSAMAQVFQAYGCRYAMLLDMNSIEHTYLALYARHGDKIKVQHLVSSMAVIDRNVNGQLLPRFVAYPDNRDFFYFVKRETGP